MIECQEYSIHGVSTVDLHVYSGLMLNPPWISITTPVSTSLKDTRRTWGGQHMQINLYGMLKCFQDDELPLETCDFVVMTAQGYASLLSGKHAAIFYLIEVIYILIGQYYHSPDIATKPAEANYRHTCMRAFLTTNCQH